MLILFLTDMTNLSLIGVPLMNKEKEVDWDEKRWIKFWKDRKEGYLNILARLHKEARGLKGSNEGRFW